MDTSVREALESTGLINNTAMYNSATDKEYIVLALEALHECDILQKEVNRLCDEMGDYDSDYYKYTL